MICQISINLHAVLQIPLFQEFNLFLEAQQRVAWMVHRDEDGPVEMGILIFDKDAAQWLHAL